MRLPTFNPDADEWCVGRGCDFDWNRHVAGRMSAGPVPYFGLGNVPSRTVGYPAWERAGRQAAYDFGPEAIYSMDGRYLCPSEQWVQETPPRDPYCGPVLSGLGTNEPLTPATAAGLGLLSAVIGGAIGGIAGSIVGAFATPPVYYGQKASPALYRYIAGGVAIGTLTGAALAARGAFQRGVEQAGPPA